MKFISKNKIKLVIICIIFLAILIPIGSYNSFLNSPASKKNKNIEVRITSGMSSSKIIDKLFEDGLIKNKSYAKLYMKINGLGNNFKAGVYKFNLNMTPKQIFGMLENREIDLNIVNFTIPEGYSVKQIGLKLYNLGLVKSQEAFYDCIQNDKFNYKFLNNLPNRTYRLEGYFFPATYEFEKGMSVHTIIDKMLSRFDLVYSGLEAKLISSNITLDKAIVMASMIEGEARLDSERPLIAEVILNRLSIKMKLQIDATVQYALGVHKNVLYYKDLKVDSLYNTYKYKGLPVGPICNPGKSSIEAALSPAKGNYIYYIAKGDGGHFFTNSYKKFLDFKKSLKK